MSGVGLYLVASSHIINVTNGRPGSLLPSGRPGSLLPSASMLGVMRSDLQDVRASSASILLVFCRDVQEFSRRSIQSGQMCDPLWSTPLSLQVLSHVTD